MEQHLFRFFENPDFSKCFFTGVEVSEEERISVFPQWILDRYNLREQWMGMLNWNRVKFGEIFIPCSFDAAIKVMNLEDTIRKAFEKGYEGVKELDEDQLFLWMGRIMLGILYHDILYSIELGRKRNKPYHLSPLLTRKFSDLHYMIQSLVMPVKWTAKPFSIVVKKVNYSQDIFNFRDETKNLNFSLGMNGFGIVACLQDMGDNMIYNHQLLEKMGDSPLHAIQFEELCARFIYSNFLLHEHPGWELTEENNEVVMNPKAEPGNPVFSDWDDKTFAQVLPDYYKTWGIQPKDIYTFPNSPLSFLIDEGTNQFIKPEDIDLPS